MSAGYTLAMLQKTKAASPKLIGVRLGRYCIDNDIAVSEVAKKFGVSRAAVYCWFVGAYSPHKKLHERIAHFISE